jgi:hypothetical protein
MAINGVLDGATANRALLSIKQPLFLLWLQVCTDYLQARHRAMAISCCFLSLLRLCLFSLQVCTDYLPACDKAMAI